MGPDTQDHTGRTGYVIEGLGHVFGPEVRVRAIRRVRSTEVAEARGMEEFDERTQWTMRVQRGGRP